MKKEMFDRLVKSVKEAGKIYRGEQQPSRMIKMIDYKGYIARIQFDKEDQIFVGEVIGIDDIIAFHSENEEEIIHVFHNVVDDHLETCK